MILDRYLIELGKRPLPTINKIPLASAHNHARDEIINCHRMLPTDRVLVQKRMELSQYQFDLVVKALRLLCELDYKGNTDYFCDLFHYVPIDADKGIEIDVYDDGYPTLYGFTDDDPVVCVACYLHDRDTNTASWNLIASFVVHKDFFKPTNTTTQEQPLMAQNVHQPLPPNMREAICQAVTIMEHRLSESEIRDLIVCDQCTLTAQYRPQLPANLDCIYNSLDDHDKGVLQDCLDDMWIMYCITRYADCTACYKLTPYKGGQSDGNEG